MAASMRKKTYPERAVPTGSGGSMLEGYFFQTGNNCQSAGKPISRNDSKR